MSMGPRRKSRRKETSSSRESGYACGECNAAMQLLAAGIDKLFRTPQLVAFRDGRHLAQYDLASHQA
jgi:hypothetical protein